MAHNIAQSLTLARGSFVVATADTLGPVRGKIGDLPFVNDFTPELLKKIFVYGKSELKIDFKRLGKGTYGTVFSAKVNLGDRVVPFVVKMQEKTSNAVLGLERAKLLSGCGLVNFKTMELNFIINRSSPKTLLATFMDHCQSDCSKLKFKDSDDAGRNAFVYFLDTLYACLFNFGISYTDMKPENVGYIEMHGMYRFRLLDLDGTDSKVSTYPAIAHWATSFTPGVRTNSDNDYVTYTTAEQMRAQTQFAFEICKMMVCSKSDSHRDLLVNTFSHITFLRSRPLTYKRHDDKLVVLQGRNGKGYDNGGPVSVAAGKAFAYIKRAKTSEELNRWERDL
jgi:hypothetical protein